MTARRPITARTPFLLLLMVLAALLLAAGCGEDSGSDDGDGGAKTTASDEGDTTSGDEEAEDGGDEPEEAAGDGDAPDCDAGAGGGQTGDQKWDKAPAYTIKDGTKYTAQLTTTAGAMTVELLPEDGPCAVNNFVFLAKEGFYDGVAFHRIMKDFMVQTGDPLGTGMGGPGYNIKNDEVDMGYERGIVAMANAGRDTGGSQFFIVHGENVQLPPDYSIFGKVTKGLETLDAIANTPVADNGMGEPSKPTKPVKLTKVTITEG